MKSFFGRAVLWMAWFFDSRLLSGLMLGSFLSLVWCGNIVTDMAKEIDEKYICTERK